VAVRPHDAHLDPADAWLPIAALLVVGGTALRADPLLTLIDVAVGCVLLGASIAAIAGCRSRGDPSLGSLPLAPRPWAGSGRASSG
jgi:hypothetical protein